MTKREDINYNPDPDGDWDECNYICPYCRKKHNGPNNSDEMRYEDDVEELECACGGVFEIWRTWSALYHARPLTAPARTVAEEEQEP